MAKIFDGKLIKFIVVGIVNTALGAAIMFGLYNLAGCSYWISSAANYVLVSVLSFVLNRRFTFQDQGSRAQSGIRFFLNIGVCYFLAYGAAKPLVLYILRQASATFQENAAMILGMCIFVLLNYLGQRFFVFRRQM